MGASAVTTVQIDTLPHPRPTKWHIHANFTYRDRLSLPEIVRL